MAHRTHNPFAGIDLVVPIDQHDSYNRYCQSGGRAIIDESPFPRMVDLWFASLSIAMHKQIRPVNLSKRKTKKIIEGSIFDRDNWRIPLVMLIAIEIEGKIDVVGEPRRMMAIANGLAAAGLPFVTEMLKSDDQPPIWNLSESLYEILQ